MRERGSSLTEVLEYGPIVAVSDELGDPILVTVNGAYYNLWTPSGVEGRWTYAECYAYKGDLYSLTVSQAMDRAKEILDEATNPPTDEE